MAGHQAELRVILLSTGTAVHRNAMREQVRRLLAEVDCARLSETLRLRRLLPVLGPRILELAEGCASDDFTEAVEQAVETGRRQGAFLQLVTLRLIAALADAGIRAASLKGPLLAEVIYGDPGRRLSSDIDLLIAPDQMLAAVEVVRKLGYSDPPDHVESSGLPLLHFALVHERGELPPVELHWRIHWYERSFARERLLPPSVDPTGDWRPAPADELAALLLFYARDGFIDLRLAADLSAWWDVYGGELAPGALGELISFYPELSRVVTTAAMVAERVVGLPARHTIGGAPKLGLRGHIAMRLANPNPHASERQLYADMGLIDGLLMPRGDFGAFVRRQLLLPREILNEYDRRAPERRVRPALGYGARVLVRCGVLVRYGLAMIRTARSPETLNCARYH